MYQLFASHIKFVDKVLDLEICILFDFRGYGFRGYGCGQLSAFGTSLIVSREGEEAVENGRIGIIASRRVSYQDTAAEGICSLFQNRPEISNSTLYSRC